MNNDVKELLTEATKLLRTDEAIRVIKVFFALRKYDAAERALRKAMEVEEEPL